MKKINLPQKGEPDYLIRQKKLSTIKTAISFAAAIIIFIIGYAIYHESASKIEVSEIIYTNYESLNKIVCFLSKTNKELIIESDLNNEIIGDCTYICTMLTNFLKNSCQDNKFYINECL